MNDAHGLTDPCLAALGESLRSLAGKPATAHYIYALASVTEAMATPIRTYLNLREQPCRSADYFVRPILEASFKAAGSIAKPEALFRIMYGELMAEGKMLRALGKDDSHVAQTISDVETQHLAKTPPWVVVKSDVSSETLASWAGMKVLYDLHFRWFSNDTHSALRALVPTPDHTDITRKLSSQAVFAAVFTFLRIALHAGGTSATFPKYEADFLAQAAACGLPGALVVGV